jgi:hypothetical protein
VRHTRLNDKICDGQAITSNYETAALFSNNDGRCSLFFLLLLREILDLQVGILGIGIADEFNLITLIDGLPAQVKRFLLNTRSAVIIAATTVAAHKG